MKRVKIGVVGCGNISKIYLENLTSMFLGIEIAGVYDLYPASAEAAAKEFHVPRVYRELSELLEDPEVNIVLNLTRPMDHFEISQKAIRAGKHVYSEKPLGITLEQGRILAKEAEAARVFLCSAPDTFLGAAGQTCRKLIDDGFIGRPVGATAFFASHGPEHWHPSPEFYYQPGGGPVLDMGPYYITALVQLLGSVQSVSGFSGKAYKTRTITSAPKFGQEMRVDVATHNVSTLLFSSGAIASVLFSFDLRKTSLPFIEIYGTEGTLRIPDPNYFGGEISLYRPETGEFQTIPHLFAYADNCRGLGVADLARAICDGTQPRTGSGLPLHVLEVLSAIQGSSNGMAVEVESRIDRPKPMVKERIPGSLQ